jgi:LacI family transcriptional regulator, galactose operon repressor
MKQTGTVEQARRPRPVTLKDVAQAAGVHVSTASRALDPSKSWRVSETTIGRVRLAADQLGYTPDIIAKGLKRGTTMSVGVVVSDFENPFIGPVLRGIARTLEQREFVTLVTETVETHERLETMLAHLLSRRVSAIITTAARLTDTHLLDQVRRDGPPIVLAVRSVEGSGMPSVTGDDRRGGELAAEHLAGLGHKVLAQLRGPLDVNVFVDRAEGFRRRIGMEGSVDVTVSASAPEPTVDEGRRLMELTMAENADRLPTAVFAHADVMAIGAIQAIRAMGLDCPRDISVIGYDDAPLVDCVAPPLSTVRLPGQEIGELAGELALRLMDDPDAGAESIVLPATLVPRASTAPPRAV